MANDICLQPAEKTSTGDNRAVFGMAKDLDRGSSQQVDLNSVVGKWAMPSYLSCAWPDPESRLGAVEGRLGELSFIGMSFSANRKAQFISSTGIETLLRLPLQAKEDSEIAVRSGLALSEYCCS